MRHRDGQHRERLQRPWKHSDRLVPRVVVRPLDRFLQVEAGSASVLLLAAVAALVWANVDPASYEDVWTSHVTVEIGPLELHEDLRHIVNDLLMAVFFYVVALEIKRELLFGALRDRRAAITPTAAALGTIAGGALAYVAVNLIADGDLRGWAVPAATDIAFALAALGVVGTKAPGGLRPFMLTLAVVDDLATILIIAVFFSSGISVSWLATAAVLVVVIVVLERWHVRSLVPYAVLAMALWYAVLESGVHATIAGVVLGFLTPALAFQSREAVGRAIKARLEGLDTADREESDAALLDISHISTESVSPLVRMEERLHPWTALFVLPVFALANAGVPLSVDALADALTGPVGLGIVLGLVVGAPIGGIVFAWAALRSGQARVPAGLQWSEIVAVTPLKGIGFTVAIFISTLALDGSLQNEAKLAVLVGSLTSALVGIGALLLHHRGEAAP
jgi:Na+:H+ antiporter, NhaA family